MAGGQGVAGGWLGGGQGVAGGEGSSCLDRAMTGDRLLDLVLDTAAGHCWWTNVAMAGPGGGHWRVHLDQPGGRMDHRVPIQLCVSTNRETALSTICCGVEKLFVQFAGRFAFPLKYNILILSPEDVEQLELVSFRLPWHASPSALFGIW